jgi:hypothetical protein
MGITMNEKIKINRAPVLTLWAAVVLERLEYTPDEALTLAKAVTGLNAQSKGRRLGIFPQQSEKEPETQTQAKPQEAFAVEVLGRPVPAIKTPEGIRAIDKEKPISPQSVQRYLELRFGEALPQARRAFEALAASYSPEELKHKAFRLYEDFRPNVPEGEKGWGAKGVLDLEAVDRLQKVKSK